jgi:cytochrome P450
VTASRALGHVVVLNEPAEVRANILTFIAAGHETTANYLSWSLYLLSRAPEWRDRVADEAHREMDGPVEGLADRLVLTRAVIEEAIRLYPPIAATSRMAKDADEPAGLPVRRGSVVVSHVLHRHRRLWRYPDYFDPARFLGQARAEIDRFSFLPFGAGMRTCIGSASALQEATLLLAAITREFELQMALEHRVWPLLRVRLRPAGGLPMTVRRRPVRANSDHIALRSPTRRAGLRPEPHEEALPPRPPPRAAALGTR